MSDLVCIIVGGLSDSVCKLSSTAWQTSLCVRDTEVDQCASSHCGSGGRCISLLDHYHCECYDGYYGRDCQWRVADTTTDSITTTAGQFSGYWVFRHCFCSLSCLYHAAVSSCFCCWL